MNDSGERIRSGLKYPLIACAGVLSAFCLMSPHFGYGSLFLLSPLFYFLNKEKKLSRILLLTLAFYGLFAGTIYVFSLVEILHYFLSISVFSLFAVSVWLGKRYLPDKMFYIYAPLCFVAIEYIHCSLSYVPTYLSVAGNALAATYFLGLARIVGFWGLSVFNVSVNSALAYALALKHRRKEYLLILGSVLLASMFFGVYLAESGGEGQRKINIAAAVALSEHSEEEIYELLDRLEEDDFFLDQYLAGAEVMILEDIVPDNELLFFPENIFDTERKKDRDREAFIKLNIENNGKVIEFFRRLAIKSGAGMIFGINTVVDGQDYISLLYIDNRGEIKGKYDKTELMIGSEYWPFGDWTPFYWRWLGDFPVDGQITMDPGYSRSATPFSLLDLNGLKVAPLACSEAHKPKNFSRAKKQNVDAIFAAVNNNWYFALNLDYYINLHLNILKINAVASGLPIILNGKDNYAGVIYPNGRTEIADFKSRKKNEYGLYFWQGILKY